MASFRQICANRKNASKSTGPKTAEGKNRCRGNALRHGLAGAGVVLPQEEAAAVAGRTASWSESLKPTNAYQGWLVGTLVTQSVRIDRCTSHETTLRTLEVERAGLRWDEERRLDAAELGERLAKSPALTALRLTRTRHGCDWLIARWEGLARALEAKGDWDDAQRTLALDLLGLPPNLRDGPAPFDRLAAAAVGIDTPTARLEFLAAEIERLEALKADALDDLDAEERAAAEVGLGAETSRELRLLRRYESACSLRMDRAFNRLHAARRDPSAPVDPEFSAPEPARPEPPAAVVAAPPVRPAAPPVAAVAPPAAPRPVAVVAPVATRREGLASLVPVSASPGNRKDRRAQKAAARRSS